MILISSCSCLCTTDWTQVLSREWICRWSSADRRCSNYIWVINNFIAYPSATYIRGLMVFMDSLWAYAIFNPDVITAEIKLSIFSRRHFHIQLLEWKVIFLTQTSLEFVPSGPIDNKSTLVRIMAWRLIYDKPLPVLTKIHYGIWDHWATIYQYETPH